MLLIIYMYLKLFNKLYRSSIHISLTISCSKKSNSNNGSLIFNDIKKLEEIIKIVDIFGLSIDSLDEEINNETGRNINGGITLVYLKLIK